MVVGRRAIAARRGECHIRPMTRSDASSPRRVNVAAVALVALIHVAAVIALIRAFAPDITDSVAREVVAAFTVTITAPPSPQPTPAPQARAPEPEGAAAEAGRKATPRAASAPVPRVVLSSQAAPPVAGQGLAVTSGARDQGAGTGGGGQGSGTGSGAGGSGQGGGGGLAAKAVKISGEINSARDYPAASREQRLGDYVIVALTVGADGRVKACRVHRPSRDPQADQITCRLATDRFRFRPATDAAGNPIQSSYGWQQRWYDPRDKKE